MDRRLGRVPPQARFDRVILICFPAVITSVVLYGLYYYLEGAWQLLAVAGGGIMALAGLGVSLVLHRRLRHELAASTLLLSVLVVLGVVPLFIAGFTPYILVSAALLILVVGASVLPGHWRLRLTIAAGFGLIILLSEGWAPLPRYVSSSPELHGLYMAGAITAFLAVILWNSTFDPARAFRSIRTRLFTTSLLLVLFTGVTVSYFSTVVLVHKEQRAAAEWLSAVTARTAGEIGVWTSQLQVSLDLFVHHGRPELLVVLGPQSDKTEVYRHALEHLRGDLADLRLRAGLYEGLYLLDPHRNELLSVGGPAAPTPPLDALCLRKILAAPCLAPPHYYASLGKVAVVVTEPVLDSSGSLLGVVAGVAGMEALSAIVSAPEGLGDTGVAYLVGADSTLLTAEASPQWAVPTFEQPAILRHQGVDTALKTRANGSSSYNNLHGMPVVGAYRWLPQLEVALLAEQDRAEAIQSSADLFEVHLGVTLILLTTAAVTTLYTARGITAPIGKLADTAEQIADGALSITADVEQDDELGTLARSFNRMTERLRQARDQLEQRVEQRTEELARANARLLTENSARIRTERVVEVERNKLKRILDAIEDGVYIVNQRYEVEYANPTLEREFGPIGGQMCYAYLHGRAQPCPWCPNEQVWQGATVRREEDRPDGRSYEVYDRLLANADGTRSKLAIFHEVTGHKQAQAEILQRNRELAILSRQLVEIQERERHHISRELHDETSQALTSLMLRLGMLERDMHQGVATVERVAELKRMLEEVLGGLHRLASDLRPPSLDHVGLVAALRQYVERLSGMHDLAVEFGALGLEQERLPHDMEITIYRIVQEALMNIVRHARATHAEVIVERRPDRVRVIVEDNGCGFDMATSLYSGRLGLLGMRERAEMLGGRLVVDSSLGAGTTVLMEVPYGNQGPDR